MKVGYFFDVDMLWKTRLYYKKITSKYFFLKFSKHIYNIECSYLSTYNKRMRYKKYNCGKKIIIIYLYIAYFIKYKYTYNIKFWNLSKFHF